VALLCITPVVWAQPEFLGLGMPPGASQGWRFKVADDGSKVAGWAGRAYVWTRAGGEWQALPDLPGGSEWSQAIGMSRDGHWVLGTCGSATGEEACRWTDTGGTWEAQGLGLLPGQPRATAYSCSDDGGTVSGGSSWSGGCPPPRIRLCTSRRSTGRRIRGWDRGQRSSFLCFRPRRSARDTSS
jgi:uncharacterized membrane protein